MRRVELPGNLEGHLFLHSMPGRYEPFEEFLDRYRAQKYQLRGMPLFARRNSAKITSICKVPCWNGALGTHHLSNVEFSDA